MRPLAAAFGSTAFGWNPYLGLMGGMQSAQGFPGAAAAPQAGAVSVKQVCGGPQKMREAPKLRPAWAAMSVGQQCQVGSESNQVWTGARSWLCGPALRSPEGASRAAEAWSSPKPVAAAAEAWGRVAASSPRPGATRRRRRRRR
jgi:hypothetical protein